MTNKKALDLARQWAADIDADRQTLSQDTIDAAADLILSLPDSWVDAKELRKVIDRWDFSNISAGEVVDMMRNLLPVPKPRTLADVKWDDEEHTYMEALTISGRRHILLAPMGNTAVSENTILVAGHDGGVPFLVPAEGLFPTGRYARLALPDEDTPEPERTRPEDVPVGEPWQVEVDGLAAIGYRNDPNHSLGWSVVYRDVANHDFLRDSDVTLIARLVPEPAEHFASHSEEGTE